jgi:hypothetical protein
MNKKYIIEQKDLENLPESYSFLGSEYAKRFKEIEQKEILIHNFLKKANNLKIECSDLIEVNTVLYKQLKFIKKSYVPKVYLKVYRKNNKPQYYVHVVIKFFNYSKTVYLGKREDVFGMLVNRIPLLRYSNINSKTLKFLTPIIKSFCLQLTSKDDFISTKFQLKFLLDDFIVNKNPTVGFNDFLKSLSKN